MDDAELLLARDAGGELVPVPEHLVGARRTVPDGVDHLRLAHPADRPAVARAWAAARDYPGQVSTAEIRACVSGEWQQVRIQYLDATDQPDVGAVLIGVRLLGRAATPDPIAPSILGHAAWTQLQIGPVGDILRAEGDVEVMYGMPASDLVGRNGLDFIHPDDHPPLLDAWVEVIEGSTGGRALRQRIVRLDGSIRWALTSISRPDPNGPVIAHDVDLSPQLAAEAALLASDERFRLIADEVPDAVFVGDADGRVRFANGRLRALLGASGATPPTVAGFLDAADVERWPELVACASSNGSVEIETTAPGGRVLRVRCQAPQLDGTVVGVVEDITTAVRLRDQVRVDGLTGLLTRTAVSSEIERAISADALTTVVAFVDLDGFKEINDLYGHTVGDRVLRATASHLRDAVRPGDRIGRWGGDEFVVVADGIDDREVPEFCDRLRNSVVAASGTDGPADVRRASIGITRIRPGDDLEQVIARADSEMYADKRAGRAAGA